MVLSREKYQAIRFYFLKIELEINLSRARLINATGHCQAEYHTPHFLFVPNAISGTQFSFQDWLFHPEGIALAGDVLNNF